MRPNTLIQYHSSVVDVKTSHWRWRRSTRRHINRRSDEQLPVQERRNTTATVCADVSTLS